MKEIINPLKPGTLLRGTGGCYKIEEALGQGTFGITYRAVMVMEGKFAAVNTGVQVAVKEFYMRELCTRHPEGTITGGGDSGLVGYYKDKFLKESRNLAALGHPNIVRVIDCFEEFGTAYYVMEYVEGCDLNAYLAAHGPMPEQEACAAIRTVAEALGYMHSRHMLHLDLKPANVMRRAADGHLILIDFGLSKRYDETGEPESSTTIGLGTPGYAPIEQAKAQPETHFMPTIDVYALGGTFYKLLTGQTPPDSSSVLNDDLPLGPLRQHGVSERVIRAVQAAMQPRKKDRLQTVTEFLDALEGRLPQKEGTLLKAESKPTPEPLQREAYNVVRDADTLPPVPQPAPSQPDPYRGPSRPAGEMPQPTSSRKWTWVAAVAVAVCAILAGTLVYLADFGKDTGGAEVPLNDSVADADTGQLHVYPHAPTQSQSNTENALPARQSAAAETPVEGKETAGGLPEDANSDPVHSPDQGVAESVEVPPSFPGGEAALLKCISSHLEYPSIAAEQEIQGVVILRFVILEDGSVGDVVVQKSLHPECDRAAMLAVRSLPKFVPGSQNGHPVKTWFTCPIRFTLQ